MAIGSILFSGSMAYKKECLRNAFEAGYDFDDALSFALRYAKLEDVDPKVVDALKRAWANWERGRNWRLRNEPSRTS